MRRDEIEKRLEAQIAASRSRRHPPGRPAARQNDDESSQKGVRELLLLRDIVRGAGHPSRMDVVRRHAEELFEVPLDVAAIAAAIRMRRRRPRNV